MDELTQIIAKLESIKQVTQINDQIVRLSAIKTIDDCLELATTLLQKGDAVADNQRQFKFHSDAAHGWLAVKRDLLYKLKIEHKISRFSYQKGSTVYLEEDMDMTTFINAFTAANGYKPMIIDQPSVQRAMIRSYESFYA